MQSNRTGLLGGLNITAQAICKRLHWIGDKNFSPQLSWKDLSPSENIFEE